MLDQTDTDGGEIAVVQYWHSQETPAEIAEMIATFGDLNPGMRHMVFSKQGAEEFIAFHLGERELNGFRTCAVPAMQADYFRYCAALTLGGIYVDADFRCVHPLDSLTRTAGPGVVFQSPKGHINNGFFAFATPQHPLLRLALDVATENIERRVANRVSMVTGPWVFSSLKLLHNLGSLEEARRTAAGDPIERMVHSVTDAIGDYDRLAEAFEHVRIVPFDLSINWIAKPEAPPAYKQGDMHWTHRRWRDVTIFN